MPVGWAVPLALAAGRLTASAALSRGTDAEGVIDPAVEVHGHLQHQHGGEGGRR